MIFIITIVLILLFELNSVPLFPRIKLKSELIFMNFFVVLGFFFQRMLHLIKSILYKKKKTVGMYVIVLFLLQFFSGIPILFSMFYVYRII